MRSPLVHVLPEMGGARPGLTQGAVAAGSSYFGNRKVRIYKERSCHLSSRAL